MNCSLIILAVLIVLLFVVLSIFIFPIGFTRWRLIDFFRLNKLLGVPKVKDLNQEDLKKHIAYFVWVVMDKGYMLRNGCRVMEVNPLSAQEGHKYIVISKDNMPFTDVCRVTVDSDISGIEVKATIMPQSTKDYENMMNIMGWNLVEVLKNLREVDANVKETKQNIINRYIDYMMREIL